MNRMLALCGESLVQSRWLPVFSEALNKVRLESRKVTRAIIQLQESMNGTQGPTSLAQVEEIRFLAANLEQTFAAHLQDLELAQRRLITTSERLYRECLLSRMRPFSDGIQAFPRLVRDLARRLGKQARLETIGQSTPVDRDILEKLEAPLTHLLRNALDHGIETPDERLAAGKEAEGVIRMEAKHAGGRLVLNVTDDGRGLNLAILRQHILAKHLATREMVNAMSEAELLEFLFLPGFSTRDTVTELSGRGIGLDVVHDMIREVEGKVEIESRLGRGTRLSMQLPLTRSVVRSLLVQIAEEPYAFPLSRVERCLQVPFGEIKRVENRQYLLYDGQNMGLLSLHQLLELPEPPFVDRLCSIIVLRDRAQCLGLHVDRFLGERDLVIRPLDERLGKIPDISATSIMEDGSPLLVLDVDDLIASAKVVLAGEKVRKIARPTLHADAPQTKRILLVEDSITVRQVERQILEAAGYEVDVSVDGVDGWNAVRTQKFDLLITDIDMPRLDGIQLLKRIKCDEHLKDLPVMVVSYKDNDEDRLRGLEAGASYYLTKSSFHDDQLLKAVLDLIGEARG
jgi:two-component system sensor histidine kinase and response regulator WspE